jgi:hypothetical protein
MRPILQPAMTPALRPALSTRRQQVDPVLAGWLARSYVAGRDGALTILRNTPMVSPTDGQTKVATGASAVPLTDANACVARVSRGGITLPFIGVGGARTQVICLIP